RAPLGGPRVRWLTMHRRGVAIVLAAIATHTLAAPTSAAPAKKAVTTRKPATTTKRAAKCHPSYQGACVPVGVEDVDCAGGGGNGPFSVTGPIRVVGFDEYQLDRDRDGLACEPRPF